MPATSPATSSPCCRAPASSAAPWWALGVAATLAAGCAAPLVEPEPEPAAAPEVAVDTRCDVPTVRASWPGSGDAAGMEVVIDGFRLRAPEAPQAVGRSATGLYLRYETGALALAHREHDGALTVGYEGAGESARSGFERAFACTTAEALEGLSQGVADDVARLRAEHTDAERWWVYERPGWAAFRSRGEDGRETIFVVSDEAPHDVLYVLLRGLDDEAAEGVVGSATRTAR